LPGEDAPENGRQHSEEAKFVETAPDAFEALRQPPTETVPVESTVLPLDHENEKPVEPESELEIQRSQSCGVGREVSSRLKK